MRRMWGVKMGQRQGQKARNSKISGETESPTENLRLICNMKSCWIISIMGRLPTNKLLSGGKWDEASPGPAGGLDQWHKQIQSWRKRAGLRHLDRMAETHPTGSGGSPEIVHEDTKYKWNTCVRKRITFSCVTWNEARSRWSLIPHRPSVN